MLTDLATGAGGPAAVRTLAGIRRSRTLVLLRAVRDLAAATGHPEAAPTAAAFEALARVHRSAPAAAERLLAAPMVGAWAMSTVRSLAVGDNDAAEPGRLAAVAAAAALHGSVPLTLELPAGAGSVPVVLPTIGTATFPDGSGAVTFRSTGTEAELVAGAAIVRVPREVRSDAEGWRGARLISTGYRGMRLMLTVEGLDWLPARDRADRRADTS
jgi:HEXXH motif-containing protein